MAAFDTPWLDHMSSSPSSHRDGSGDRRQNNDASPPTIAPFSPITLSHAASGKQRATILVHQKSPLLIATPPQITRALAYSHPFLLPLNQLAGLLTWTCDDPWQSFLLVAGFWAAVLYGDNVLIWAGPIVVVIGLTLGMYSRRYSPLSSTGWTGEKQKKSHKRTDSESTNTKHQKTLDEIVETLKIFTSRCNLLLDPLLMLTDFLSTQQTATSATTRPALTTLFIRILLVTPIWITLTTPPVDFITSKRVVLVTGTLVLTWHSKPATVTRTVLWRSAIIRRTCAILTGLNFTILTTSTVTTDPLKPSLPPRQPSLTTAETKLTNVVKRGSTAANVKFTFILYENQRRWVGLGWTTSLFAYERGPWTNEHNDAVSPKDEFDLPAIESTNAKWQWVQGSQWHVEGAKASDEGGDDAKADASDGGQGWIYYDNKWQRGRRGQDGWGRYTRRRKWYRDAELVEIPPKAETTQVETVQTSRHNVSDSPLDTAPIPPPRYIENASDDGASVKSGRSTRSSGFRSSTLRRTNMNGTSISSRDDDDERISLHHRNSDWGIGDDARMGLE